MTSTRLQTGKRRQAAWRPVRPRSHQTATRGAARLLCSAFALAFAASAAPVAGQLFERPLALRNARIVTMTGPVVERGTILLKGGRITAVGADVKPSFLAKKIDLTGKTVTPGFIDAWSALGRLDESGQGDPTSTAWDTFDRYAGDDFREALRQGVTTVYVGPGSRPGVGGTGVVVRLVPGEGQSFGTVLKDKATLSVQMGSGQSPIARLKTFYKIRKQFQKALDYRQSLEDYEEDLKEYLDKLKERRKKEEAADQDAKKSGEKKDGKPVPKPDNGKDEGKPKKKPEKNPKKEPKKNTALSVEARERRPRGLDNPDEEKDEKGEKEAGGEGEKKKEEELEKPKKPKPDRKSEVLLQAIDRKLRVRIEAHRSEDILNALELADEFRLDIILEGATEAYLVADRIAEADVPVVLGPVVRPTVFHNDQYHRHQAANAAALTRAGVRWTVGSGAGDALAARSVAANAQLAAAYGAGGRDWMRTVTTAAARILGVGRTIGRVAPGRLADLVVWSGDPGDPSSVVERVYVGGKLAYTAPQGAPRGGGR